MKVEEILTATYEMKREESVTWICKAYYKISHIANLIFYYKSTTVSTSLWTDLLAWDL